MEAVTIIVCICAFVMLSLIVIGKVFDYRNNQLDKQIKEVEQAIKEKERRIEAAKTGYNIKLFTTHFDEVRFIATISHTAIFSEQDSINN